MDKKVPLVISKFLKICFLIFAVLIGLGTFNYYCEIKKQGNLMFSISIILLVSGFFALLSICYLLAKIPDQYNYNLYVLVGLIIFFIAICLIWIFITPVQQVSDYNTFWQTAGNTLNGKHIYKMDNDYFARWPYQTGFLTYIMLVIKLFGANLRAIQLLNIVYQVIILLLVYCLTLKLFNKVVLSRWSVFLLSINLEWLVLNNRVTNQYISLVFFLLSLTLILSDKNFSWLGSGISLAIGNYLRPIGIVYFCGIVVFIVIYRLIAIPQSYRQNLFRLLSFLVTYLTLTIGFSCVIQQVGLNKYGLMNRDSIWKIVTGLNYRSGGTNRLYITKQFKKTDSRKMMQLEEKKFVRHNISELNHQHLWLNLFINKFNILWSYPSNSFDYTLFRKNYSSRIYQLLKLIGYSINTIEMILLFVGAFLSIQKKEDYDETLLLFVTIFYVIIQLIIEVQGRYRIEFTPILLVTSSLGTGLILNKVSGGTK